MKNDMMYWALIGIAFAVTLIIGPVLMKKTNKFAFSFWISTAVNLLLTALSIYLFVQGNEEPSRQKFGIIVYGISCVNLMIIDAFILFSMRNKGGVAPHSYEMEYQDDEEMRRGRKDGSRS